MDNINIGKKVFEEQAKALCVTASKIDDSFNKVVNMILDTQGRVIISGMGKSGIIGNKIAATFASTGTPSYSVHPAEAYHGDLGMFTAKDLAILISNSGETDELIRLLPSLRYLGIFIVAIVGNLDSTLAKNSDLALDVSVEREACPNNLAPTTSTTVTLAMGDAIAVALIEKRQFKQQDFALFHPGGTLGRRLLTKVNDVMHTLVPNNAPNDSLREVIVSMTRGGLGITVIICNEDIRGIITDGDLRRAMYSTDNFMELKACEVMSAQPKTILGGEMFVIAEEIMISENITSLIVLDNESSLLGIVKLHDIQKIN